MSDDLFRKILGELRENAGWIESVALYWLGEPLLDPDIVHKVRALRKGRIKSVQISTNASLLDVVKCEQLFEVGLNDLRISLDAITKKAYEGIRCGLRHELAMENVHAAIKLRDRKYPDISIRLRFVQQENNMDE